MDRHRGVKLHYYVILPDKVDDTKRWLQSAAAVFVGRYRDRTKPQSQIILAVCSHPVGIGTVVIPRDVDSAVVSCAALSSPFRRVPIR